MIKLLILVFIISSLLLGQVDAIKISNNSGTSANFEFGIRDEAIVIFSNESDEYDYPIYKNEVKFLLPINLHLSAGIRFLKQYKIDFRFGIITNTDYIFGLEEGLFFKADLFNTTFFGTAGIDFFNNSLANGGTTNPHGKFTFYFIGLGYETSRNFDFDIMYGFPAGNRVYATGPALAVYGGQIFEKKINGLFKLGFQYSFIF
jgi:hypothetical protein